MTVQEGGVDLSVILIAASIVGVTTIIVAFLGCMWCRNKWKKLTRGHYQFTDSPQQPAVTEFTLFPPPPSGLSAGISPDEVVFEPLPEIRSRVTGTVAENLRPARFTASCEKVSLQDWFDEYQVNFPREHLQYVREVGAAWYGQAVEGEAVEGNRRRRVVVKILRVDATSTELTQFLQESRVCRDLKHPNLLNLLNRCLEVHPFLLIMEHCDMDLKSYLIEQRKSSESLLKDGSLLRMACDITTALQYMHEHGFIHMDVAAHSCLVTSDGVIKLGDYGTAVHLHKSDFYCLGDVAFPIRWCAPETLMCTENVIEAKDITREANIWSFGVVLWELLEFCKLPYVTASDNDVVQKVLIEGCLRLEQPRTPCAHKDMIYKIMQLCWLPPSLRPSIQKVSFLLRYLHDNRDVPSETFESRWNSLQPHNIPPTTHLHFDNDFTSNDGDSNEYERGARGDKSPSSGSMSIGELVADMSPSLLNLRGSVEDLIVGGDTEVSSGLYEGLVNGDTLGGQCEESSVYRDTSGGQCKGLTSCNTPNVRDSSVELELPSLEIAPSNMESLGGHERLVHSDTPSGQYERSFTAAPGGQYQETRYDKTLGVVGTPYNASLESEPLSLETVPADLEASSSLCKAETTYSNTLGGQYEAYNDTPGIGTVYDALIESEPASLETISDSIHLRIDEAIRDLDTILAEETCSEASGCNTPEKRPSIQGEFSNCESTKLNGESAEVNSLARKTSNELCKSGAGGHVNVSMVDD